MRWILATVAISYLFVMSNHERLLRVKGDEQTVQHAHNREHRDGLIAGKIIELSGIVIRQKGQQWQLSFDNQQWQYNKAIISADNLELLKDLLAMLMRSEPVRTFLPEDLAHSAGKGEADYGLAEPRLQVSVFSRLDESAAIKQQTLAFGHATPDGSLHYVKKTGDPALYVMSGFLYQQAEMLMKGLGRAIEN